MGFLPSPPLHPHPPFKNKIVPSSFSISCRLDYIMIWKRTMDALLSRWGAFPWREQRYRKSSGSVWLTRMRAPLTQSALALLYRGPASTETTTMSSAAKHIQPNANLFPTETLLIWLNVARDKISIVRCYWKKATAVYKWKLGLFSTI